MILFIEHDEDGFTSSVKMPADKSDLVYQFDTNRNKIVNVYNDTLPDEIVERDEESLCVLINKSPSVELLESIGWKDGVKFIEKRKGSIDLEKLFSSIHKYNYNMNLMKVEDKKENQAYEYMMIHGEYPDTVYYAGDEFGN